MVRAFCVRLWRRLGRCAAGLYPRCLAAGIVLFALCSSSVSGAEQGIASVYKHGRRTANGERFQPGDLTAAHRRLPFNSRVRVINRRNNKSVVVRINDRGPFVRGRIIDLTPAGAKVIGFSGLASVIVERF